MRVHLPAIGDTDNSTLEYSGDSMLFMLAEELRCKLSSALITAQVNDTNLVQLQLEEALRTIDTLLLYRRLDRNQIELCMEPVHIGAILSDVQSAMYGSMKYHKYDTDINIQSSISTVHSDPEVFRAGISSLWQAVYRIGTRPSTLNWKVFQSHGGVRISVTSSSLELESVSVSDVLKLAGRSSQPMKNSSSPATDLIIAQGIFDLLGGKLRKIRSDSQYGFGVTIPKSKQLAFL